MDFEAIDLDQLATVLVWLAAIASIALGIWLRRRRFSVASIALVGGLYAVLTGLAYAGAFSPSFSVMLGVASVMAIGTLIGAAGAARLT